MQTLEFRNNLFLLAEQISDCEFLRRHPLTNPLLEISTSMATLKRLRLPVNRILQKQDGWIFGKKHPLWLCDEKTRTSTLEKSPPRTEQIHGPARFEDVDKNEDSRIQEWRLDSTAVIPQCRKTMEDTQSEVPRPCRISNFKGLGFRRHLCMALPDRKMEDSVPILQLLMQP